MNFLQLQNRVYTLLQESSTNTSFPLETVKMWINEGYRDICGVMDWPFLYEDAAITLPVTTCSNAGNSTGTTLYVTSSTNFTTNQTLLVNNKSIFEEVRISEINGNTITLEAPGLNHTYECGDEVSVVSFIKPADLHKIIVARSEKIQDSKQQIAEMRRMDEREFRILFPQNSAAGSPTHYFERNNSVFVFPSPNFQCRILLTYIKNPSDLVNNTDTPVIPLRFRHILAYFAVSCAFEKDENVQLANYYKQLYLRELARMKTDQTRFHDSLINFKPGNDKKLPGFSF
jgi:hypothetical protein